MPQGCPIIHHEVPLASTSQLHDYLRYAPKLILTFVRPTGALYDPGEHPIFWEKIIYSPRLWTQTWRQLVLASLQHSQHCMFIPSLFCIPPWSVQNKL